MMKALIIEDDYNTAEIICLGLQVLWLDVQPVSTPFGHIELQERMRALLDKLPTD